MYYNKSMYYTLELININKFYDALYLKIKTERIDNNFFMRKRHADRKVLDDCDINKFKKKNPLVLSFV